MGEMRRTRALSAPDNPLAQAQARFEAGRAAQELLDELIPLLAAIHHDKLPMPLDFPSTVVMNSCCAAWKSF